MLPGSHYAQTEASLDGCAGALRHQEQNCRSVSQMLLETHVLKNAVAHTLRCGREITRDRQNPCAVLSGAVVESKFRPELLPRKALRRVLNDFVGLSCKSDSVGMQGSLIELMSFVGTLAGLSNSSRMFIE